MWCGTARKGKNKKHWDTGNKTDYSSIEQNKESTIRPTYMTSIDFFYKDTKWFLWKKSILFFVNSAVSMKYI